MEGSKEEAAINLKSKENISLAVEILLLNSSTN